MPPRPLPQPTPSSSQKRLSSYQNKHADLQPVQLHDTQFSESTNRGHSSDQYTGNHLSRPGLYEVSDNLTRYESIKREQLSSHTRTTPSHISDGTNHGDMMINETHDNPSTLSSNFKSSEDPSQIYDEKTGDSIKSKHASTKDREIEAKPDYQIKLVSVGDGGSGKTCLLLTYSVGQFPTTYVPTVFENYLTTVNAPDGKLIELALWDTAGQEEYDRLRVLSYPEVNILLICFGIDSPVSLENVIDKWVPEISHFCPDISYILVGLKSDLRYESPSRADPRAKSAQCITRNQGLSVAKQIGAKTYLECSARNSEGVSEVFSTAINIVLHENFGYEFPLGDKSMATKSENGEALKNGNKEKRFKQGSNDSIIKNTTNKGTSNSKYPVKKKKKHNCVIL